MNKNKFAVIGIGQFGGAIARALTRNGAEVMAIDSRKEVIDAIAEEVAFAVSLDATDQRALMSQDIKNYGTVVVAIGSDFTQELLTIVTLSDLGIKRIIARARGTAQRKILQKLGIREIFSPEDEVGIIVAERLLNPNLLSYLQLPDDYRIAELIAPKRTVGRSLGEIDLRDRYKLSLVTIKKEVADDDTAEEGVGHLIAGVPDSKTMVEERDCLVVFGKYKDIDRFIEVND